MDAGGRAMQGAVAEDAGSGRYLWQRSAIAT